MPLLSLPNELILIIGESLGNVKYVFSLLRVNHRFAELLTPLFYDLALHVRLRISSKGLKIDESVLHWASRRGYEKLVAELLSRGADLAEQRSDSITPLYMAVQFDSKEVLKQMMSQEAAFKNALRAKTQDGRTALHVAAENGHDRVVQFLLDHGLNTGVQTVDGVTPLHLAVKGGSEAVVSMLLENGAKANISAGVFGDRTNRSIVHWIAGYCCHMAILKDRDLVPVLRLLISHGANVMALDTYRRTPLHYAARNGENITQKFVTGDRVIRGMGKKQSTAQAAHRALVALLIENGADVNAKDLGGRTPLHDAAESLDDSMVSDLLEAGADSTLLNKDLKTPMQLAYPPAAASRKVVEIFKKHDAAFLGGNSS